MNASHSFCSSVDTNYLVPTEVDQIIIIEATSLQGVREWERGTKVPYHFETIGLFELLLDREKISKLDHAEIFKYEPISDA